VDSPWPSRHHSVGEHYGESLPRTIARETRTLLGYGIGGSTLPLAHGFPLRPGH
jgi:DMSO/TMAO reductase YedYZ molybdopterin-dependent catalytic subunit